MVDTNAVKLVESGAVESIIACLDLYPASASLKERSFGALSALCSCALGQERLFDLGVHTRILTDMQALDQPHSGIYTWGCAVLAFLAACLSPVLLIEN